MDQFIKLFGFGGSGKNFMHRLKDKNLEIQPFLILKDEIDIKTANITNIIKIMEEFDTDILSNGAMDNLSETFMETSKLMREAIADSEQVILFAGLGGKTGTFFFNIFAEIAKEENVFSVAIVSKPFLFEGNKRMQLAELGIEHLKDKVNLLFVFPNERLKDVTNQSITLFNAFEILDGEIVVLLKEIIQLLHSKKIDEQELHRIMNANDFNKAVDVYFDGEYLKQD